MQNSPDMISRIVSRNRLEKLKTRLKRYTVRLIISFAFLSFKLSFSNIQRLENAKQSGSDFKDSVKESSRNAKDKIEEVTARLLKSFALLHSNYLFLTYRNWRMQNNLGLISRIELKNRPEMLKTTLARYWLFTHAVSLLLLILFLQCAEVWGC